MNLIDFQNGYALGLASGGIVEVPAKELQEKTVTVTENGTTEILPDEDKALSKVTVVTDIESSGGDGTEYTNLSFEDNEKIVLTDKDGNEIPMQLEYDGGKIASVSYDGKEVAITYEGDKLLKIGNTDIDLSNRYPTDYVLYVPLTKEATTAETGQALVKTGTDYTFQTVDGVPCIKMNNSYMVVYTDALKNKDYTLSVWGKLTAFPSQNVSVCGIGAYQNSNSPYTTVGVESNERKWFVWENLSGKATYSEVLPTQWHHLLLTSKNGVLTFYIDGKAQFSLNALQNFSDDNEEIQIGKGFVGSSTYSFGGYMSAFRVYDRALTEAEISVLAQEFKPTDR